MGLSTHESNHYACQEANLLTFKHYVNKIKIISALKLFVYPCRFFNKLKSFMIKNSDFFRDIYDILLNEYDIESLFENDRDAILSRIFFIQRNEQQMRYFME